MRVLDKGYEIDGCYTIEGERDPKKQQQAREERRELFKRLFAKWGVKR